MLGFLFGSTMFLVMLGALAMMIPLRKHKKFKKVTKWCVFACALIAGSAAALCFVGQWAGMAITAVLSGVLGAPAGAAGVIALFFLLGAVVDLLDGEPDGGARVAALVLPTLLAITGGDLGMYGAQATGTVSDAGANLFGSLIGLG
ncbi:hypothetical protein [Nocardiopsis sp. L17-MgMaSL7]|uniref:hypothetical protein n=1 Tax=Nocardiopsis sp. L17-MgMaSL7 TaxID=1938893 RepID=UPI000D70E9DE|nr:hypothetical protein [Nocardiopsis sp. L17-MgMaSL7]PWV44560.1 hypothetical protein BDW27_12319 [Nocardiopsis sp. L17-MgMaSL7]